MKHRHHTCLAWALLAASLAAPSAGCGPPELEVATGRHVIIHWDPSTFQLCGGTLEHVDNTLEMIAANYGVSLGARPNINMFWHDPYIVLDMCRSPYATACAQPLLNGTTSLFVYTPIDDHELTHAVRISGSRWPMPSFFLEGAAVRWEPGLSNTWVGGADFIGNIDAGLVRELMTMLDIPDDNYSEAGFFWIWLEAEYGPKAMAAFASQIRHPPSLAQIERAFQDTFGISVEQAVANSAGAALPMFDIQACGMPNIPKLTWKGEPLVLSPSESNCRDADIVSHGGGAVRFTHLVLPDGFDQPYTLTVTATGPGEFRLYRCAGGVRRYEDPIEISTYASGLPFPTYLSGTYVVTLTGMVEPDGSINFPHAEITQP